MGLNVPPLHMPPLTLPPFIPFTSRSLRLAFLDFCFFSPLPVAAFFLMAIPSPFSIHRNGSLLPRFLYYFSLRLFFAGRSVYFEVVGYGIFEVVGYGIGIGAGAAGVSPPRIFWPSF